jgi:ribonuclease VapC
VIIVDASAVVAILQAEVGYEQIAGRLLAADDRRISPVSWLEVTMALSRKYADPASVADGYLLRAAIKIHALDSEQAEWARRAYISFGTGRHPARLNIGDCFSYAAAKALNAPLLFVGDDFARTDIRPA